MSLKELSMQDGVSENELEQVSGGTAMSVLKCEKCGQFITVFIDSKDIDAEKGYPAKCPQCKEERKFVPAVFSIGFSPML